jgi:small RNA 2'-O-methyltransferase
MEFLQDLINKEFMITSTGRDKETKLRFNPPVYEQRYHRVADILSNEKIRNQIKNIVEFGVAEMKSFVIFKNSSPNLERVDLVDIDGELLETYKGRVDPLIAEHINKREVKLTVNIWQGSISLPNPNLVDVDAVVAIEL